MDPAFWGSARWGYTRWSSYRDDWDRLLQVIGGVALHDITLRKLSLGARDSTTGHRAKEYTESTVQGVLIPRASNSQALKAGTFVRSDALLLLADGVVEGDEIKDAFNKYYEVKAVRGLSVGDSFSHRECDLTFLPLHT